jgi:hypothetical protein
MMMRRKRVMPGVIMAVRTASGMPAAHAAPAAKPEISVNHDGLRCIFEKN